MSRSWRPFSSFFLFLLFRHPHQPLLLRVHVSPSSSAACLQLPARSFLLLFLTCPPASIWLPASRCPHPSISLRIFSLRPGGELGVGARLTQWGPRRPRCLKAGAGGLRGGCSGRSGSHGNMERWLFRAAPGPESPSFKPWRSVCLSCVHALPLRSTPRPFPSPLHSTDPPPLRDPRPATKEERAAVPRLSLEPVSNAPFLRLTSEQSSPAMVSLN